MSHIQRIGRQAAIFRLVFPLLFSLFACPLGDANGAVILQDSDFVASDWTSTKYFDATSGQSATFVASTIPSGGLNGSYRQVLQTFSEGAGVRIAHLRSGSNGLKWQPSTQGAFSSIDYSFNLIMTNYFDPAPTPSPGPAAVGYRLLLSQDGYYYTAPIVIVSTSSNRQWISISNSNLQETQFQRIDLSTGAAIQGAHPNFSATGSEIVFGYETANSHGTSGVLKATESGIDNYEVRLNDAPSPAAVPEPCTAVLALGFLSLASLRSLRRRPRSMSVSRQENPYKS